jgi:hypothetical protein
MADTGPRTEAALVDASDAVVPPSLDVRRRANLADPQNVPPAVRLLGVLQGDLISNLDSGRYPTSPEPVV